MQLVDIGANLTHEAFRSDLDAVLERAHDAGVDRMVITGADEAGSRAALDLARQHSDRFRATAGVHPHAAADASAGVIETLRGLAAHPLVVAIGEAGLDFNRDFSPRDVQEELFDRQLALAAETGLPVFAHQRDAHERFMEILRPWRERLSGIVVHCFTGTEDELEDYLAADCHVGVTGWICDERRGHHLREFVHRIPAERLMVETDAPYLLPRDLDPKPRSRRNEPMYLPHVVETIARARGEDPEALASATTATARRFFGF
jgi:TatD DNase family protein